MIKIAKVYLKNGHVMTALNTSRQPDFVGHLMDIWKWKGVSKIEADGNMVDIEGVKSLFQRLGQFDVS